MPFEVGDVVEGTVLNITDFGAFIQLPEGKTGLVHISEVANTYVKDIRKHLKEHDKVKVKILSMDANGRISLSIKKAFPKNNKERDPKDFVWQSNRNYNTNSSFEERLLKFLKDSDERQQQLRKNFDSKRRNTGYRKSNGY
ncbi:MAG: S1 domain-containing RNA-binding protein [Thermoanaerobacter sp.]|uniref:S1 domain-containing RNA-binding protein n=1 Tax=Thermoanaerobacter sp. TaxID=1755 RepID=UPI0034642094